MGRTEALELRTILSMWIMTTHDTRSSINFDLDYLRDLKDEGHLRLTPATETAVKALVKPDIDELEAAIDIVTQHVRGVGRSGLSRDQMIEILIKDHGYAINDATRAVDSYRRADSGSIFHRKLGKKFAAYID